MGAKRRIRLHFPGACTTDNRSALAARKDKIDFDLPYFQLFCLEGNKDAKFDNLHVLRQRKRLTRPGLYKQFLRRRPVEARTIKEKPTELRGADDLLAPEYSTVPQSRDSDAALEPSGSKWRAARLWRAPCRETLGKSVFLKRTG